MTVPQMAHVHLQRGHSNVNATLAMKGMAGYVPISMNVIMAITTVISTQHVPMYPVVTIVSVTKDFTEMGRSVKRAT